jgi:transketolase
MSNRMSQRIAYGEELVTLGKENPDIVALEADLGKSTMSCLFQNEFPDRYFEMGIAEQNMMSTAAGLAAGGKIPFASTFAVFAAGRAYDQIRQTIGIGKLNVNICGSSAGLSDFGDGATHQAIEDIALMSAIPNMTVLTPCDAIEVKKAVRAAAKIQGPSYIRVGRNLFETYTDEQDAFQVGKIRVLAEGSDVAIFAHGTMVEMAMIARGKLAESHISTKVINVGTMKPFDYEGVVREAKRVRAVVTAEEHTYIGGLASAVALALRNSRIPMEYVAVEDTYGQSAHCVDDLMSYYKLTSENIIEKAKGALAAR